VKAFVDQPFEVGPELGLKRTVALVRLLCDGSRVGNARIEEVSVKTEIGEELVI
jgi:hypothetical protein